jgi:hypothetical protein
LVVFPDPGTAWETEFSVMVSTTSQEAFTCDFYYEIKGESVLMVPFDKTLSEYDSHLDMRSPMSSIQMELGFKLPYDFSTSDDRLRVYSVCQFFGSGKWVNDYRVDVYKRTVGADPVADQELAYQITTKEVQGTMEEVLSYYQIRMDNVEVLSVDEQFTSLETLT